MAHPRVEQLRYARSEFARGLAGIPPEVARHELGQMNSISWMVAHLAWHEQISWLTRAQGLTPFPQLVEIASSGSARSNPDFDEVFDLWKQVCALGVLDKGIDRMTVGLGMIPRGEVGLIFANIGLALSVDGAHIITGATFSAVVVMVIVTTMSTPPALKWSLARALKRHPGQPRRTDTP